MMEVRFKLLKAGDRLVSFTKHNLVIKKDNGQFYVYPLTGMDNKGPAFGTNYEVVDAHDSELLSDEFALVCKGEEYYVYLVSGYEFGLPQLDKELCFVIKKGNDKIEYYDTESRMKTSKPAEAA